MKALIITLLMSCFLCSEMIHLKSFTSLSAQTLTKYIDISSFNQNDVIHLVIIVVSGTMDKQISYGFFDHVPLVSDILSYTIDTTSSSSYCNDEDIYYYRECGNKYYFDIKKVENAKYLSMRITGYTGTSITYSLLPMSSTAYYIIGAVIFVVCIAICVAIGYCRMKRARLNNNLLENRTGQASMIPQENQPPSAYY